MLGAFSLQEEDEMEILLGKNVVIAVSNLLSLGPSEDTFITWEPDKFTWYISSMYSDFCKKKKKSSRLGSL